MAAFSIPSCTAWGAAPASLLGREADPIWLLDLDELRFVWANAAGLALWGADSLDSLLERGASTLLDADTLGRLGAYGDVMRRGHAACDSWTLLLDEATALKVEVLLSPTDLDAGRIGMLCRARPAGGEAAVSRGVEALSHTRLMVSMFTPQGDLLFENPAAARAHAQAVRGDVFSARFADPVQGAAIRAKLEAGDPVEEEVQIATQGGLRWHNLQARVSVDPLTNRVCWIVEEQDISRRRRNEAALAEAQSDLGRRVRERTAELERQRDFFQGVFDTVSALTLVANPNGRVVQANAWARTFFQGQQLVGQDLRHICNFPAEGELEAWFAAGDAPPETVEVQVEVGPERRSVLWTPRLTPAVHGGQQLVLSGVDVTPLRESEAHLQVADRMATIGTLAAGIAHDLNNPLAVIITNSELLLEEAQRLGLSLEALEMVRETRDGAQRAAAIVSQLRAFARGAPDSGPGAAHVRSVVEFAARMVRNQVRHRANLEVECPDDLFARIHESRLGQVVLNLLMLALDAIEAGQASRHHVRVSARAEPGGWVVLQLQDDGPGLKPEDLRRVFDPYSGTHTPPQGFAGLGLAVSHHIVTEAGGRIEVDSAVGRGTRVQVWLPSVAAPRVPVSTPRAPSPTPEAPKGPPRILLVDDEDNLRSVIRRALRDYTVDGAASGREALSLLARERYDLILCDVMMPEMTGVELFGQLQALYPDLVPRVVFLSGGAFTAETQRFLDSVGRPIIDKPFRMDELRRRVQAALGEGPRGGA
jgi:signal transduction histidine kinase